MNWAGITIAGGLVVLGMLTMPYGLVIFAALGWLFWTSK